MSATRAGYLFAFLSAVTGAIRYNLAVYSEPRGLSYIPFLACILAVGVLCSGVHVLIKDGAAGFRPLAGRWWHALTYGLLMGLGTLAHFWALHYLNETLLTSLSQTSILLTIGLSVWLLGERFSRMQWIATSVIFAGVFVFAPWSGGGVELRGFLILMAGLVAASLATIGAKKWITGTPASVLMFWRNLIAFVIVGVYYALNPEPFTITLPTACAAIAGGVFGPYLHGLFFLYALQRIDAGKAALMNRVQPAVVFVLSYVVLDRLPEKRDIGAAVLLALGAAWLASLRSPPAGSST